MVLDLSYNKKWDEIPKEELPTAYYGILSLSCALDVISSTNNHIEVVEKLVEKHGDKTNEELWYLTIISFLKMRTKVQKSHYAYKLLSDMMVKYSQKSMDENIGDLLNQINHVVPYEGFFVSLYDGISKEDPILESLVSIKEELREKCEKHFIFKNVSTDFLERTIYKNQWDNKYINQFDLLFDVLIMFFIQKLEEIFMDGVYHDEMAVRAYVFEAVEHYAAGIFTKNSTRIANSICSMLATKELALKEEKK